MSQILVQDELELTIVGTMLLSEGTIGETLQVLAPSDFTLTGARLLFQAMGKLFLAGKPTDELSVLLEAGDDCKAVMDLILDNRLWTSDEGLAHYRVQLRERSRLRQLRELGSRLSQTDTAAGAEAIVAQLNGALTSKRETRVVSIQEAVVDFMDRLERKPVYLPWGMKPLDAALYAELGDFIILGGYSSSGKTLLAIQFALLMAQTYRVGFFSLETSDKKLTDRTIANHAKVAMGKIKRRTLAQQDYDLIAASAGALAKLDLTLVDAAGMSVTDIQAVTLQQRFQIIFVDYLQIIRADGVDLRQQVTKISVGLHTMAQTHGVTVIALAQLSRPDKSKTKDGRPIPPGVHSLRESSQLENDADIVMILYPQDPDDNGSGRILKVGKNKEGEKLAIELAFDGATQTLTPVSNDRATAQKFVNEGRKVKQKLRQERLDGFEDEEEQFQYTDEEVPF